MYSQMENTIICSILYGANWCIAVHRAEEASRAGKFNFIVDYKMS